MGLLVKHSSTEKQKEFTFLICPFGNKFPLDVKGITTVGTLNQVVESTVTKIMYYDETGKGANIKELLKEANKDVYNSITELVKDKYSKLSV